MIMSPILWILSLYTQLMFWGITESVVIISYGKPVSMSSVHHANWTADKAVDNDTNTNIFCQSCAHTLVDSNVKEAYYQIDFQAEFTISSIEIYYREAYSALVCPANRNASDIRTNQRFKGYRIYISNSSAFLTGHLCYRDNSAPYPTTYQNNSCSGRGSYLTIYNNNTADHAKSPALELCEIRVYGCALGFFGTDCSETCFNCINNFCDVETGSCEDGCKDGWIGVSCNTKCGPGLYGRNCSMNCSNNCVNNEICNHVNGSCTSGCAKGYKGDKCDTECDQFRYGHNCNETCGNCVGNKSCDRVEGTCNGGCDKGWEGSLCKTECSNDRYGYNCNETCGKCFQSKTCDRFNGTCDAGCDRGRIPPLCRKDCIPGSFGYNCTETCGNCKGGGRNCQATSGTCSDGCIAGWNTTRCNNECIDSGLYGENCMSTCSANCFNQLVCNHINGSCPDGCSEGFYGERCEFNSEEVAQPPNKDKESSVLGIVLGVGIAALLVICVGVLIIFRRRKSQKQNSGRQSFHDLRSKIEKPERRATQREQIYENQDELHTLQSKTKEEIQNVEEIESSEELEDTEGEDEAVNTENVYFNISHGTRINITGIRKVIQEKTQDKVFGIEYKMLPHGVVKPQTIGEKPENKMKNRYRTTFPYDHSIVRLSKINGEENSDYINANYINDVKEKPAYIATQGPRSNTVFAFWRMIWETKAERIVMLTKLKEVDKVKCYQYWPKDNKTSVSEEYLKVTMSSEKKYCAFTSRKFLLVNTKTNESRHISHLHFTSWPDHGTPDPIRLLTFHHLFTQIQNKLQGPSIVHCSAGIGRTGVFIALDALMESGLETGVVDVFEFVNSMRENRVNMVQTQEQYIAIHETLAEGFMLKGSFIPKIEYIDEWHQVNGKLDPKNKKRCEEEFQALSSVRPILDQTSKEEALSAENKSKNKDQNILPDCKFRPYLFSQPASRNNYINAVILPTFHKNTGMIATQFPFQDTVEDFWCMVRDHESDVVVILQPQDKSVSMFPTGDAELKCGTKILTEKSRVTEFNGISKRRISLKDEGEESPQEIMVLEARTWSKTDLSSNTSLVFDLIQQTNHQQRKQNEYPITVVCPNGARGCGLFALIYLTLELLEEINEVNIFQIARQLQLRRPQFFSTIEEYEFCYTSICEYLENSNIYANS